MLPALSGIEGPFKGRGSWRGDAHPRVHFWSPAISHSSRIPTGLADMAGMGWPGRSATVNWIISTAAFKVMASADLSRYALRVD